MTPDESAQVTEPGAAALREPVIISLADPDGFWASYEATLARIRAERPSTVEAVAAILNDGDLCPPPACIAKFGSFGDDRLDDALADAGWQLRSLGHRGLWQARHPASGEALHYAEAHVYRGPWPDPGSPEYARDYDNGWRTAKRDNTRLSSGGPGERTRLRNVSRAWRDGFDDQAADRPKWTWQHARAAGWDNVGNYEFAWFCGQGWARELGVLPAPGPGQQAMDALSAFHAFPSWANLHALDEAVGAVRASHPDWFGPDPDDEEQVVVDGEVWEDAASWSPPLAPGTDTPPGEAVAATSRPHAVSHQAPEVTPVQPPAEMVLGPAGLSSEVAALGVVAGPLQKPAANTRSGRLASLARRDTRTRRGRS